MAPSSQSVSPTFKSIIQASASSPFSPNFGRKGILRPIWTHEVRRQVLLLPCSCENVHKTRAKVSLQGCFSPGGLQSIVPAPHLRQCSVDGAHDRIHVDRRQGQIGVSATPQLDIFCWLVVEFGDGFDGGQDWLVWPAGISLTCSQPSLDGQGSVHSKPSSHGMMSKQWPKIQLHR